jgi:diguanylate cyclase (GGDEF)-like protein/PAS domain S-box-containing protein
MRGVVCLYVLVFLQIIVILFLIFKLSTYKHELKATKEKLKAEEMHKKDKKVLESIIEETLDGYWDWDIENDREYLSPSFKKMFGYEKHELNERSKAWHPLVFDEDLKKVLYCFNLHFDSQGKIPFKVEVRYRHKQGHTVWVLCSGRVIEWDKEMKPLRMVGCHVNITEMKMLDIEKNEKQRKIEYLSYHDQLTGLYNRGYFEEELMNLDKDENLPISVIVADLNGLKITNDAFGHVLGDELIKKAAEVLTEGCSQVTNYTVSRVGGDEFTMLLPKTSLKEVKKIINKIEAIMNNTKVGQVRLSISLGYETKADKNDKLDGVLKRAEDYMYKRKFKDSEDIKKQLVHSLLSGLEERKDDIQEHLKRVAYKYENLHEVYALNSEEQKMLRLASMFHDLGIVSVDEKIINKPSKLSIEEWVQIKRHPEIGYRILNTISEFSEIANIVLAHHERWDGKGYPKGLKGTEIPYMSRILAVVDAYDAMTTPRVYKRTLAEKEAVLELKRSAGTQFDEEIAQVFVEKVLNKSWVEV